LASSGRPVAVRSPETTNRQRGNGQPAVDLWQRSARRRHAVAAGGDQQCQKREQASQDPA
jgi:hypothetical protein